MRSRLVIAAAGGVLGALAVVLLLVSPRWFALVVLALLLPQLATDGEPSTPRSPWVQLFRTEVRTHVTVEQGIRGLLLVWSAAAMGTHLAAVVGLFYAGLLSGSRFIPRLANRLTEPRYLIESLPPAQAMQDRTRLFDSASRSGRQIRANIRRWTNWLELPTVLLVVIAAFGWDADDARWAVVVPVALVTMAFLLEGFALVASFVGRSRIRFHDLVVDSLAAYRPEYVLYFSAPATAVYQIRQWLPHLMALDRKFVILTRENALVTQVAPLAPGVPVISSPRLSLLDRLVVDSVRAVFYVNNGMRNAHMLRHTHLRHVQMLHGESDKAPSVNKFARAYDQLYVAGQAAIDRYAAYGVTVDPSVFRIIGRPQADDVRTDVPDGRPTVLYAPTWEGWNPTRPESSVGVLGVELVRRLLARGDVRVIVRPHPTTGLAARRLLHDVAAMRALVEQAGGDHVWSTPDGALSLVDCFNQCTVMISDISSVMADFLRSEKPLVVTDVDGIGRDNVRTSFPTAAASWILRPDAANIDEIMDDVLGEDSLRDARHHTRRYVLGDIDGPAQAVFHAQVVASIDEELHDLPHGVEEVIEDEVAD